jgi:hypothetical protein
VSQWSPLEKLFGALVRSAKYFGPEMMARLQELFTKESLWLMAGGLLLWIGLHGTPAGWALDLLLLAGAGLKFGWDAWRGGTELGKFLQEALGAEREADLEVAGQHFAAGATILGPDLLLAWFAKLPVPKGPTAAPMAETVAVTNAGLTVGVPVVIQPPPVSVVAWMAATGKRPGGTNSEGEPPPSTEPTNVGLAQEDRVRTHLRHEGYTEPYGADDTEIARQLGIKGKRADFVMQHGDTKRWLIADSKGGDMYSATQQIENTAKGLQNKGVHLGEMDFKVYTNEAQYEKLLHSDDGVGGYRVNGDGALGWFDEAHTWQYAEVEGKRITVHKAP